MPPGPPVGLRLLFDNWETREQAGAAAARSAEWVSENMADSVALEENLIGEMTTLAATERSAV